MPSRAPCPQFPSAWFTRSLTRFKTLRRAEPPDNTRSRTSSPHRRFSQRSIPPLIYQQRCAAWQHLGSSQSYGGGSLRRNSLLKVVSWNIDFASPGPAERAAVMIEYLQRTFGDDPGQLAIVLQEVCRESVQQILQTRWVQQNFVVAGHDPPQTLRVGIPGLARYFTLVMIPISLRLENSFRMAVPSQMGRDALFIDIPICPSRRPDSERKDVLRLCTTHLESLDEGTCLRKTQLELISNKLSEHGDTCNVIAGLVGGDMNAIHDTEHTLHRQVGLKDAWEDTLPIHALKSEHGEDQDVSSGEMDGHTWGYQPRETEWAPKRFDKFMYTGCVETVTLSETPGLGKKVGRLGIGLQVGSPGRQRLICAESTRGVWVSDHFGIAIGIKVVPAWH